MSQPNIVEEVTTDDGKTLQKRLDKNDNPYIYSPDTNKPREKFKEFEDAKDDSPPPRGGWFKRHVYIHTPPITSLYIQPAKISEYTEIGVGCLSCSISDESESQIAKNLSRKGNGLEYSRKIDVEILAQNGDRLRYTMNLDLYARECLKIDDWDGVIDQSG